MLPKIDILFCSFSKGTNKTMSQNDEDPQDIKVITITPAATAMAKPRRKIQSNYVPIPLETLNESQRAAFDAIAAGKSIFITGPGGTGKSYLIQAIYNLIPDRTGKHVSVTALTGCAALLLGRYAKTLHSWAGIGLGRSEVNVLVAAIRRSGRAFRRWLGTDILIIDEVSMMTSELLEKLDEVARHIRRDKRPFGGIQVVFVGDFFQLPPVVKASEGELTFVFESPTWKSIVQETISLTQIHRQADPEFQKILNEARVGSLSEESIAVLKGRQGLPWAEELIRPTLLFTRRAEVDNVNDRNLKALPAERKLFKAETVFAPLEGLQGYTNETPEVKRAIEKLDKDAPYMVELVLAQGAQVMLLVNKDPELGLVNGSRGVVVGFDGMGIPMVQFKHGAPIPIPAASWESDEVEGLYRKQIPLRLAYAITIHKAQGATLDSALIDIGTSTFEYGQAYVALSRVRSLDSLYIWDIEPTAFKAHPKVKQFYSL
jgi:ATP-dependent DNA helicase PIF1